jgi:hypothetical protein
MEHKRRSYDGGTYGLELVSMTESMVERCFAVLVIQVGRESVKGVPCRGSLKHCSGQVFPCRQPCFPGALAA